MTFLDRFRKLQERFDGRMKVVGHGKYGRILRMARKPATEEYVKVLQITFLGAVLIGGVGFIIYIFFSQLGPWIWGQLSGIL
jgi:protein transport protein SEC61 subunit gamma-like protein